MSLPSLALDDRTFDQLVEQAKDFIRRSGSAWTDLSAHDPGVVLLEVFAHLTETMLYRLNRLPEKAYVEFLRLLGLAQRPTTAAVTTLRFTLAEPSDDAVAIPQGVRVTTAAAVANTGGDEGGPPPVFTTAAAATIAAGETSVTVRAYHCVMETERLGVGTGRPGQTFRAGRPFVQAAKGGPHRRSDGGEAWTPDLDVRVGVEVDPESTEDREPAIVVDGRMFRIWDEATEGFTLSDEKRFVYLVDRATGVVHFAPALRQRGADGELAESDEAVERVPGPGREVRIWGPRGGGPSGNRVAAGTLTVLKPQRPDEKPLPPGLTVTNVEAASGGVSAESVKNALLRGPLEFRTRERAITALDYETLAERNPGVARARAFTLAEKWAHAQAGTVEVVLVPALPEALRDGPVSAIRLAMQQTDAVCDEVQQDLAQRRPLGTFCRVRWARYKSVSVHADLVVHRAENEAAVERRVLDRLNRALSPLPGEDGSAGWGFGVPLTVSHVYHHMMSDRGVSHVRGHIRLVVDEIPDQSVTAVAADVFQRSCWYVGSGARLFRSENDAGSWEQVLPIPEPDATIPCVEPHPTRPGWVAVACRYEERDGADQVHQRSRVYVSKDCGETWDTLAEIAAVRDLAWAPIEGRPVLFLASEEGLFRIKVDTAPYVEPPLAVRLRESMDHLPLHAVASAVDADGRVSIAVAVAGEKGVFLSSRDGRTNSFREIKVPGGPKDVRVLEVQREGARSWLWAGVAAFAADGVGCLRRELVGDGDPPDGWVAFSGGWRGGSCESLTFRGRTVYAGSDKKGVLVLDLDGSNPAWQGEGLDCGLPLRDGADRFEPVAAVAAARDDGSLLLAGGQKGLYESRDGGRSFSLSSRRGDQDAVGLPATWLFCSGEHRITVVGEDETS